LFRLEPETAHELGLFALRLLAITRPLRRQLTKRRHRDPRLAVEALGRTFPNPIGLAAGFDKNAVVLGALPALGFGFAEVGTVTLRPQMGNPKPRLFRYPQSRSLQNRLGFNNAGADKLAERLHRWRSRPAEVPFPIGVNLGKNRDTAVEDALDDYTTLIERFALLADYLVVNVSSPNTPGLRALQSEAFIERVLSAAPATRCPILVKLDPDLPPERLRALAEAALQAGAAGIIATNTTVDHALLPGAQPSGGLSGAVLRDRSRAALVSLAPLRQAGALISVGGVDNAAEVWERLRLGAHLVQIYTAWVYAGPGLVPQLLDGLVERLDREGVSIGELVPAMVEDP
jgi:dihydroorotate dehydrogenase